MVQRAPLDYAAPCPPCTRGGAPRAVGLELEFGHLSVGDALRTVARALGGTLRASGATGGAVTDTVFGEFKVELDSKPLQERRYLEALERLGVGGDSRLAEIVEDSVLRVAREIVPVEVVTPPIPWNRLSELDVLWEALREHGAEDTKSSVLNAFGLHLNPELPDLEPATIVTTLRSYFVLESWLMAAIGVDISRRVAPYIHPFPEEYRARVVDPGYRPDLARFTDDYVAANPTRNRPLDLLPLIRQVTPADFSDRIETWSKVKARPAFHYRLPNSELEKPNWTPAIDWNRWVVVERLAGDPPLLEELSLAYLKRADLPGPQPGRGYVELVEDRVAALLPDGATASA